MSRADARNALAYAAKLTVAKTLVWTGAMSLRRRTALRRHAAVLAYHRVLPDGSDTASHPGIVVSPETFDRQMSVLKREFRPLTLAEFETHISARRPFEPGACLVTFDDGWIDTFTTAWPILEKYAIPAVVFLPTNYIGTGRVFWQETLGHRLLHARHVARDDAAQLSGIRRALDACGLAGLAGVVARGSRPELLEAIRRLKLDPALDPGLAIAALDDALGAGAGQLPLDRFMTWDEVRALAQRGLAFGAHGHTHHILSRMAGGVLSTDLEMARDAMTRELGTRPTALSYPNGGWNDEVIAAAAAAQFRTGFTMDRGHVSADDAPFALRRMNIHDGLTRDAALFRGRVLGIF
jgi:peptidoglycan/xylan/chitin deacetylase (PgdA/CDA1 family)